MAKDFVFWSAVVSAVVFFVYVAIALIGNRKWKQYEDEHQHFFGDRNG